MDDEPVFLDAKGLKCPLPVLRARKALKGVAPGGLLEVLADDPAAPKDFRAFCETAGCALEESAAEGTKFRFLLRSASR